MEGGRKTGREGSCLSYMALSPLHPFSLPLHTDRAICSSSGRAGANATREGDVGGREGGTVTGEGEAEEGEGGLGKVEKG